jgi:hypothetical protein
MMPDTYSRLRARSLANAVWKSQAFKDIQRVVTPDAMATLHRGHAMLDAQQVGSSSAMATMPNSSAINRVFERIRHHTAEISDLAGITPRLGSRLEDLRTVFEQVIERRHHDSRRPDWFTPATVSGLSENLPDLRQRPHQGRTHNIRTTMRALIQALRRRSGSSPGKLVTCRPQLTRGPNSRRSIRISNFPAGLARV